MKKIILISFIVFLFLGIKTTATQPEPPEITAELVGFTSMYVSEPVAGSVRFTITNGRFADTIFPEDFTIRNLPAGFTAENAIRTSNTVVTVRISGTPTSPFSSVTLIRPNSIAARNIHGLNPQSVPVTGDLVFPQVGVSATISPTNVTFDINPSGLLHRDIQINLNPMDRRFVRIEYGNLTLDRDEHYIRDENIFRLSRSFLSRLPVGEWGVRFIMSQGANPVVTINVIDSRIVPPPPIEIGPDPVIPDIPIHTDEAFINLSGTRDVDSLTLQFPNGIARLEPVAENGIASIRIRVHAMDNLAWQNPNTRLEIRTPFATIRLPINIIENIRNARAAMENHMPNEVYFRLTLIDRSSEAVITNTLRQVYPNGQVVGNVVDIRAELIDINTGEVFFNAGEFNVHNEIILHYMPRGFYTKPSAVHLLGPRTPVEFVPHYVSQNTVSIRSLLPGIHAVVHNGAYFNLTNLPPEHIGFPYANEAATMGIVNATGQSLGTTAHMTRAEFAHLVALAVQLPTYHPATMTFPDVPSNAWFYNSVMRARSAMFLWHYDNQSFRPNAPITREEMLSMAAAALVWNGTAFDADGVELSLAFLDSASISRNRRPEVQIALNNGLVVGRNLTHLSPLEPATRLEAIIVIIRLIYALE